MTPHDDPATPRRPEAGAIPARRVGLSRLDVAALTLLALAIQSCSAIWLVEKFGSPNFAVEIARNLASTGVMQCSPWWRLKGENPTDPEVGPLLFFHLPGHPVYLAAGFRWLPERLHRFLHVPVTALLVVAPAWVLGRVFGRTVGLGTAFVGLTLPFVILHGPVFDDTFLGAALDWLIVALLMDRLGRGRTEAETHRRGGWLGLVALLLLGAWGATTRAQSVPVFALAALAIGLTPGLASLRSAAVAIVAGMGLGIGLWGLRNLAVVGVFALGSSHDGITLYESNYSHARAALLETGQVERLNHRHMQADFAATRAMTEHQADRHFAAAGVRAILDRPFETAVTGLIKLAVSLTGVRPELSPLSPRNLVALGTNLLLATLALVGLTQLRRAGSTAEFRLLLCFLIPAVLGTMALLVIGPAGLRYRIGIEPPIWGLAALGAVRALVAARAFAGFGLARHPEPRIESPVRAALPASSRG